jgi:hypothetical protein
MDHEILRALAGQVAELANLDIQSHNQELHRAVNSLRMIRPVVLLDELPWNQLNQDGELTLKCQDEFLRTVEQEMRRTLYRWNHCRGDMIVEPFYRLNRSVAIGDIGVNIHEDILASDGDNNIVSHHYIDQLSDEESLEKLHPPEITVDDDLTQRRRALLDSIFGDILPIRVTGVTHAGFYMPWDNLAMWRGVEPIYVDLMDNPELLHAFMRKFLDIRLDLMTRLEKMNLLDADLGILHCTPGLVDELPGEIEGGRVTRKNLWGRGTAQVFASVSPAMHDEFEIEYAKAFFEGFGLVYYGCCEPLHNKIDIVKKLPNLRKISITPWADVRKAAERIGRDYVLSRKPNPASVAVPSLDEEALRKDILETLTLCRENGTPVDITLKDISTVCYNPNNLTRWEQVVMETVRNF